MSSSLESLLRVRGLRITARAGGRERTILDRVDLDVAAGETVSIVGESGSGKSMTARAVMGLLPPGVSAEGDASFRDLNVLQAGERRLRRLRGAGIGMILQDPFTMLNPLRRCGDHITEALAGGGSRRREAERRLAEVGITDPRVVDRYPFELSGGMRQRVAIAAALALDPELLIADEPSTALDVTTQSEVLKLLKRLQAERGMGLVLITHDLRVAFSVAQRVYVLYAGSVLESGGANEMEREPAHPYTLGLLLSEPPSDRTLTSLYSIAGSVPSADEVATRCAFSPRCQWAAPECIRERPALLEIGDDRRSACVRLIEIRDTMRQTRSAASERQARRNAPRGEGALLSVNELQKVFRGGARARNTEVVAVNDVSLTVGLGESVGLVGESGSGKTTLARCIVGLETPTSGEISLDGSLVTDWPRLDSRTRIRMRRTVQMIFQDPYSSLNPVRTVGATLSDALRVADVQRGMPATPEALLAYVGLPSQYARRKPVALSGGERQRVAIARALAVGPRLLVCDEPVSALDVSVQAQILNLLLTLRERLDVSFLFITHDLSVVRQVAERIYVMSAGSVVEEGATDAIFDSPKHEYTAGLVESVAELRTGAGAG